MRILALDIGTKRCGVAISDISNTLSSPYSTVSYNSNDYKALGEVINKIIEEKKITDLVVGNPKNMDGSSGFATKRFDELKSYLNLDNITVHLIDERLTTVFAQNILKENGTKIKKGKKDLDVLSACLILEDFLKRLKNGQK